MNKTERGARARSLLENEFLNLWWESAEASVIKSWKAVPITDSQGQLELKAELDALLKMQRDFKRYVQEAERERAKAQSEN